MLAGLTDEPISHTRRALEMARELGVEPEQIMLATVQHGLALGINGRMVEDAELLEAAKAEFPELAGTRASVRLNAELARARLLLTEADDALRIVDETLPVAERRPAARGHDHADRSGGGRIGCWDAGRRAPRTGEPELRRGR